MHNVKDLEGFFNALGDLIEGADSVVANATAFLSATQAIEKFLTDEWPTIERVLRDEGLSLKDRRHLLQLLETINGLETKTQAHLSWTKDFESHMKRAMEKLS